MPCSSYIPTHLTHSTGTEKARVNEDYIKGLYSGWESATDLFVSTLAELKTGSGYTTTFTNTSAVLGQIKEGQHAAVITYNNLGWTAKEWVEIVTPHPNLEVYNSQGDKVASQVDKFPDGSIHLYFLTDIPPFGFSTYFIRYETRPENTHVEPPPAFSVNNNQYNLSFVENNLNGIDNYYVTKGYSTPFTSSVCLLFHSLFSHHSILGMTTKQDIKDRVPISSPPRMTRRYSITSLP